MATRIAWGLFLAALLAGLFGAYMVGLFLAIATGLVAIAAEDPDRAAARRRSEPVRYWHARPSGGRR